MAIYKGLFGSSFRFVRADSMGEAVQTMRAAFGFAPRGFVSKAGENGAVSIGYPLAYDQAAAHLDGANNRLAKAARVKSRAKTAHGKGAILPANVEIMTF